jgi:hypothetical protein
MVLKYILARAHGTLIGSIAPSAWVAAGVSGSALRLVECEV